MTQMPHDQAEAYWRRNLLLMARLLVIWFLVSFGCGVLLVDWLNQFRVGGYKVGFWFAQQGSIYIFVLLTFYYAHKMAALDREFGGDE